MPQIDLSAWRENNVQGCQIAGRQLSIGESAFPTPCTSCVCTNEGVSSTTIWLFEAHLNRAILIWTLSLFSLNAPRFASPTATSWLVNGRVTPSPPTTCATPSVATSCNKAIHPPFPAWIRHHRARCARVHSTPSASPISISPIWPGLSVKVLHAFPPHRR